VGLERQSLLEFTQGHNARLSWRTACTETDTKQKTLNFSADFKLKLGGSVNCSHCNALFMIELKL